MVRDRKGERGREREREREVLEVDRRDRADHVAVASVAYYSPDLPHASVHDPVSAISKQTLPSPSANAMLPA